jgi:hypothetical protein
MRFSKAWRCYYCLRTPDLSLRIFNNYNGSYYLLCDLCYQLHINTDVVAQPGSASVLYGILNKHNAIAFY